MRCHNCSTSAPLQLQVWFRVAAISYDISGDTVRDLERRWHVERCAYGAMNTGQYSKVQQMCKGDTHRADHRCPSSHRADARAGVHQLDLVACLLPLIRRPASTS